MWWQRWRFPDFLLFIFCFTSGEFLKTAIYPPLPPQKGDTQVDLRRKKAWLWRYRSAKRFELLRLDEVATLEAEARRTTQRYSALPGGSGDGQTLPRCVERIDEARRAAEAQAAVCDAIRAEIMAAFRQLDNEVDFMILFRRYILLEDWPDIAVIVRISRSQMFQRHSAAVKRLDPKSPDETGLDRT